MALGLLTESDGFAIVMLAMIGCSFGILVGLFFTMWWKVRRRDHAVDDLIQEVETLEQKEHAVHAARAESPTPPEPWNRGADWWKEQDGK